MRAARSWPSFLLAAAALAVLPVPRAFAQDCDYKLVQAWWSAHPSPDSIYVNFMADVEGPVSSNPLNPSHYDMSVAIRFNHIPVMPDQQLTLVRWATPNACVGSCPSVVCRREEWVYKNVPIIQESRCLKNAQNVCGCPSLGTPVPHQKPVPKPPAPVTIEIELIPLSLQSCNPINPGNNKIEIPYPQQSQPPLPGLPWAGLAVLAALLVGAGSAAVLRLKGAAA